MTDETAVGVPLTASGGKSYVIHDVGANARVQQGENLSWTEMGGANGDSAVLVRQFEDLLKRIAEHPELDEDTRALTAQKTEAVAQTLAHAEEDPAALKRAVLDAKGWLGSAAGWAWDGLSTILKSEAAQKTIAAIAETGVRTAIKTLIGPGA